MEHSARSLVGPSGSERMIHYHRVAQHGFDKQNLFRKLLLTSHGPLVSSQQQNHWTTARHTNRAPEPFPQLLSVAYMSLGAKGVSYKC